MRQVAPAVYAGTSSTARSGGGVSALATITTANASTRTASASGASGRGSPNTMGPAVIVHRLAVALVSAITGTASPTWRLRAETARPTSDAVRITSASGWIQASRPVSRWPLKPLNHTSEAPHSKPAETASVGP